MRLFRSKGNRGKTMNAKAIIIWLIVGAVAGWLAGMVVKGGWWRYWLDHQRFYRRKAPSKLTRLFGLLLSTHVVA
jgi:hypothetical protein